jgi:hypothetical protein
MSITPLWQSQPSALSPTTLSSNQIMTTQFHWTMKIQSYPQFRKFSPNILNGKLRKVETNAGQNTPKIWIANDYRISTEQKLFHYHPLSHPKKP